MDTQQIMKRLQERHGITALNEMQQIMTHTQADRIILLAPTGSGKTIAFILRLLRALRPSCGRVQAVVIAPARELVVQIAEVLRPMAQGWRTVALYGGHNMADEANTIKGGVPDIIVATPGRLLDHVLRGNLDLRDTTALVLDEYDKSLELGFYDEMKRLVTPMKKLQLVVLTSATPLEEMPSFVPMKGAETFDYTASGTGRSRLQTVRVESSQRDKLPVLADLLRSLPQGRAIVFVNHRESAERVYDYLRSHGFQGVGLYHGGLEQRERQQAVDLLNNGTTPILVSTDLASRGLDITDVNYVIHYHLPLEPQAWVHRNGRTARQGRDGTAYAIIAEEENVPEYVTWQRSLTPKAEAQEPIAPMADTLYINAGRREKISKGDIVGYLIAHGGLTAPEIGPINLSDHSALVAVPVGKGEPTAALLAPHKLKNTRVRVSKLGK